jgi:hypothetical protein
MGSSGLFLILVGNQHMTFFGNQHMKNLLLSFVMASIGLAAPAQQHPIVRPDGRSITIPGIDSTLPWEWEGYAP